MHKLITTSETAQSAVSYKVLVKLFQKLVGCGVFPGKAGATKWQATRPVSASLQRAKPHGFLLLSIIFSILLSTTSCSALLPWPEAEEPTTWQFGPPEEPTTDDTVVETVAEAPGPVPFAVLYVNHEITRAMYEPAQGTYLGAWLWPTMSKPNFEETVNTSHAVFAMEKTIGDEFPTTWIWHSISAQAAPLIVLNMPQDGESDFPLIEIANFAYELGRFNLPVFIVFNPKQPEENTCPNDYVLLFRHARHIFHTYVPMAAFVWHGYNNETTPESPFYPGHDVVDWVSFEALAPQTADGFTPDIPTQLKPFYLEFQQHKPIILLPLGIGHFSRRDYVYRVPQAATEITRVFANLRDSFPRVRLVVYGNNGVTTPYGDDFSLTREECLINAYREAVDDNHFLNRFTPGSADAPTWLRSPLHGYYYEGQVFIDRDILLERQHRPIPSTTKEINGRDFVNINAINWMKVATDHTRRVIYIQ